MDGGGSAGFDAAVIAIDAVVLADGGVLEVIGFLFVYEKLDVVAQRALIAFQGEDIDGVTVRRWSRIPDAGLVASR